MDQVFIKLQYSKAENALRILIEEEGCCNAFAPMIDALTSVEFGAAESEENKYMVLSILDITSGAVDIDFNRASTKDRLLKINEAINFLTVLRSRYEA